MSYQVIARKWRPQTFEEVTGQETVTKTLQNALEYDRLHHAYLFSGARGVGKTTTARLLAKALNCHKTDKPNLHPCRTTEPDACPSCVEISESRSIDVLEIDAASYTGIDAVRDTILEGININPARDRFKVFIIDEVHQLSRPAFNALLKTLEEPPPNVVFIMATTELHKVPDTILSRCQQFEFRTISTQKIFESLKKVAAAENLTVTDDALREVARSGEGSMRDAQSNFDQVISFAGEKISAEDVIGALGITGTATLERAMRSLIERQPREMLEVVDEIVTRGQDMRNFCRNLLSLFRDLLVYKVSGGSEQLLQSAAFGAAEMEQLSAPFTEADLLRFFNYCAELEVRLRDAINQRYVLEGGLVSLIEMRRVVSVESILERLASLETPAGRTFQAEPPSANETPPKAISAEKKTLISEAAAAAASVTRNEEVVDGPTSAIPARPPTPDLSFIDSMPVMLSPIDAAELEHVDDNRLDSEFEDRLMRTGDDLSPFPDAERIVGQLGLSTNAGPATDRSAVGDASGAATARAVDVREIMPDFDSEDERIPLPTLSDAPTQKELLEYAGAHPLIRQAMRIFRGKIIHIEKKSDR